MSLVGIDWKLRALAFTGGNKSLTGAIVVAMLGRICNPPCFAPAAIGPEAKRPAKLPFADFSDAEWVGVKKGYPWIGKDGMVYMVYCGGLNERWKLTHEHVMDFRDRFRRLADALDLSDVDRLAMFDELKKFIVRDERAVSNLD